VTGDQQDNERPVGRERKPGSRYSLFVGVAFVILIVVATANTLRTRDDGILGTSATEKGVPLPQFAVPELLGSTEGDANVFQDDCETGSNPCPSDDRRTPACQVDVPQVIRVCDLLDKPLVISFWFTGGADCLPTQDLVDQVARRFAGRVNFLSVNVRDDRDAAREIVRERGWQIPVGWDADGAVSNLYRVGGCPTVAFAYPGGVLSKAAIGTDALSEQQLTADVEALIRESDRRAREDR
jgi:thiol-disulfide isomerase/thioredoxin